MLDLYCVAYTDDDGVGPRKKKHAGVHNEWAPFIRQILRAWMKPTSIRLIMVRKFLFVIKRFNFFYNYVHFFINIILK